MSEVLDVRRATFDDHGVVLDVLAQGASYALSQGIDQWPERFPDEMILRGIERHEVHVGVIDGAVVATLTLAWSDPDVWEEDDGQAGYVHRLAVKTERRGVGLGRRLLHWAQVEMDRADRTFLRLDCLERNAQLRRWYESIGFVHLRDREVLDALGAPVAISLYQRPLPPS